MQKNEKLKYAYYVGCAAENFTKELDISTRAVCMRLGIDLVDIEEFSCCGAGVIENKSELLQLTVNARNFALAEKKGLDIMVTCSTCLVNMRKAKSILDNNPDILQKVNKNLSKEGLQYKGKTGITHILWLLINDYGMKRLEKHVKKQLKISVAPYYGCHILRPSKFLGFDDPRNPKSLDQMIRICGAEVVDFDMKKDCCGFHTVALNERPSMKMAARVIEDAKINGADALVVVCPFCHVSLDAYQPESLSLIGKKFSLPVVHLTQLLGLALGLTDKELGMEKNMIHTNHLLLHSERLELD